MPNAVKEADIAAAAAEGFDTSKIWFHGTGRRFNVFRDSKEDGIDELGPGIYVTGLRYVANAWARKGGFILSCVIRKGPLFNYEDLGTPATKEILWQGWQTKYTEKWGDRDPAGLSSKDYRKHFEETLRSGGYRVVNYCLSGTDYVGGFKRLSQIPDQLVVYRTDDVRIIARAKGE